MKTKFPLLLFSIFLALFLFLSPILAAVFKLTSIGNYDVSEGVPAHVWYSSLQPTFVGSGTAGATVTITVDTTNSYSTTVGTNEQWAWTPTMPFVAGDHDLVFSSESETVSFTLTAGSTTPSAAATESGSPSGTPVTGIFTPTFLLLIIGSLLVVSPLVSKFAFKSRN